MARKPTPKQRKFARLVILPEYTQEQAYRESYNVKKMSPKAIRNECQKLLKNPVITRAVIEAHKRVDDKFDYTVEKSFEKLKEIQKAALAHRKPSKWGMASSPAFSAAIQAEKMKGELTGLYVQHVEVDVTDYVALLRMLDKEEAEALEKELRDGKK